MNNRPSTYSLTGSSRDVMSFMQGGENFPMQFIYQGKTKQLDYHNCERCIRVTTVAPLCKKCLYDTTQGLYIDNSPGRGMGLYTRNGIRKGEYLSIGKDGMNKRQIKESHLQYDGDKVTRRQLINRYGEASGPYVLQPDEDNDDFFIDAATNRSLVAMINAPDAGQDANAEFVVNGIDESAEVSVRAIKDIPPRHEILVLYNVPDIGSNNATSSGSKRSREVIDLISDEDDDPPIRRVAYPEVIDLTNDD